MLQDRIERQLRRQLQIFEHDTLYEYTKYIMALVNFDNSVTDAKIQSTIQNHLIGRT